jgi:GntR family transcriptional repressor for pyruvate dehydrogenase complex
MSHGTEEVTTISSSALDLLLLLKGSEPEGLGRAEQVSHQIETAIAMGILSEGDRLPREVVLASELGISPITLRQSLAALRRKGLIATTIGRSGGSFIRGGLDISAGTVARRLREASTEYLRDLGDQCAATAAMSAKLASSRADHQNVDYLSQLSQQFSRASDARDRRIADSRFHIAIGVAAQSSRLTASMLQVQAELTMLMWPAELGTQAALLAEEEHGRIVNAIAAKDAVAAAAAAEQHSQNETSLLIERHVKLLIQSATGAS